MALCDAPPEYDIYGFYVNTDNFPPETYYFGLELAVPPGVDVEYAFRIDCNDNGIFSDPADYVLIYDPMTDFVMQNSGDEFAPPLLIHPSFGEFVGIGIEARTDFALLPIAPLCLSDSHLIMAESRVPGGAVVDETEPRLYLTPTALTLTSIEGITSHTPYLAAVLVSMALGITLFGVRFWRRSSAGR